MRLDGWFFLEDKSSPELFFPKLSQIVFGDIFLHSCSFCLYKPSRTCCWEASHSTTLLPPCVTVETLCSWRRAVFSNRQTYYWVFFFAFENKELSSSWLLSFPRASGRIEGESSPEHFFFLNNNFLFAATCSALTGEEHRQCLVYAQSTQFFIVDHIHFLTICTKWWIFSIQSRFLADLVWSFHSSDATEPDTVCIWALVSQRDTREEYRHFLVLGCWWKLGLHANMLYSHSFFVVYTSCSFLHSHSETLIDTHQIIQSKGVWKHESNLHTHVIHV